MKKLSLKTISISAAYIAGKLGMKIVFSNSPSTAWTDGNIITLPCVPETYPVDVLHGFIAHEAGHVKHSHFIDMNVSPLHEKLAGVIEDARMEHATMKELPGTVSDLNQTVRYAMETGMFSIPNADSPAGSVLIMYMLAFLRGEYLRQPVIEFLPATQAVLEQKYPMGVCVRLQALLCKIETLKDNNDSYDLAGKIIEMLEDEADKLKQPNPNQDQGQGQGQQSSTPDGKDQSGPDATQGDQNPSGSSDSQKSDAQGSMGQGKADSSSSDKVSNSSGNTGGSKSANAEKQLKAIEDALAAADKDLPKDVFNELREQMVSSAQEAARNGDDVAYSIPSGDEGNYIPGDGNELMTAARANSSRIRNQLLVLAETQVNNGYTIERSGQRINTQKLSRIVSGDLRVFERRAEQQSVNTAIHLLVDLSSSMRTDNKDVIAIEAALGITMGLKSIPGTDPALTYFLGNSSNPVFPVLEHGCSHINKMSSKVNLSSTGSTPMGEAIFYALSKLATCQADKHQIFVVTDGSPSNLTLTLRAISECEKLGVEMFGIGIGVEGSAVERLFKNSITINSVKELKNTLFNLFQKRYKRSA